jgi:molecular chaperone HtpG
MTEQHAFGAEVGRLLDLVVHSLYSEREIFLRELVANAADATDRRRFEALTDQSLALPEEAGIRITADKPGRLMTISDAGVGMSKEELATNLGTIARSGTRAFGESLAAAQPEDRPSLIGQFGVGFYSAFMVADKVEVTSRRIGSEEAWTWSSEGAGTYTLAEATRETPGTDIVLHIKPEAEEFLDPVRLDGIVRKWADHITVPITIQRDGKDVPANEGTALWRKPKSEVTEQAYEEFYRHLGMFWDKPWATLHWRAEGAMEYSALLFIPGMKPFTPLSEDRESHVRLHVRRMFITDKAELLPSWLRFVQGVVDTEDLPLNVSREMLQATPVLARIRRAVTNRVLTELKSKAKEDGAKEDGYEGFWTNFGTVLKEGVYEENEHRAEVAALLRFHSSTQDGLTSLADYIARMKPEQENILYLAGDDADALAASPQLEGYRARGLEVLLLTDPIDAFWPERLGTFESKTLASITRETADLAKLKPEVEASDAPDISKLALKLKDALSPDVSDVRASDRLVDSAVVLAGNAVGADLHMQRILRRAGQGQSGLAPVLEINPRHPWIAKLVQLAETEADLKPDAELLFDLALVQDGDTPRHPAAFARRVAEAMAV